MFINEIPNVNFAKNGKNLKTLSDMLKSEECFFNSINYSNEEIFFLFLKSAINNANKLEGIDFEMLLIEDKMSISSKDFNSKTTYLFHSNNKIEKELYEEIRNLQIEKKLKIIFSSKNILNADLNIQGNLSLTEEKSVRVYIEEMLNDIDKKKIIRIISNQVFNEFDSIKNGKIDILNNYQLVFNDIETAFLDGIELNKNKLSDKNNYNNSNNNNNSNKIELNSIEDLIKEEDVIDMTDEKESNKKLIYIVGGVVIVSLSIFYFTGVLNF